MYRKRMYHKLTETEIDIMKIVREELSDWSEDKILKESRELIEAEADWVPRMIKAHKGARR